MYESRRKHYVLTETVNDGGGVLAEQGSSPGYRAEFTVTVTVGILKFFYDLKRP